MNKKEIREKLRGSFDSVSFKKDGLIDVKRGYFYRHGLSVEGLTKALLNMYPNAEVISSTDRWAPWPRDSYFFLRFRLTDQSKIDAEMDLELASAEVQ
jgi:hypothetical protein